MRNMMFIVILTMSILLGGCGEKDANNQEKNPQTVEPTVSTVETEMESVDEVTYDSFSMEVTQLYQSQPLMMEMLVNDACEIEEENDILAIYTPLGGAGIAVTFLPGIQNLEATAQLIPVMMKESMGAESDEVRDGYLFGVRSKV